MNAAQIYSNAVTPGKRPTAINETNREQEEALELQRAIAHKQWLDAGSTQHFLDKLQVAIQDLDTSLAKSSLGSLSPDRYYTLKDRLQTKYLLEAVVKMATENTETLNINT